MLKGYVLIGLNCEIMILTLDEFGGFGALEPLEEQNEDLFPVLSD